MQSSRVASRPNQGSTVGRPTYVPKVCAYLTRRDGTELLVFRGPGHEGLQVPKGTVEPDETLDAALRREVAEESGLVVDEAHRLASDIWTRRPDPLKKYVRHFYHADVDEPRDRWDHVVTGTGAERGRTFEYFWVELPTAEPFALSLNDYLSAVTVDRA
jgi:8-oxo-dGTP pyrophosphatase MutT (NUDIX family)